MTDSVGHSCMASSTDLCEATPSRTTLPSLILSVVGAFWAMWVLDLILLLSIYISVLAPSGPG